MSQLIERKANLCTELPLQLGSHITSVNLEHKRAHLSGLSISMFSASELGSERDLGLETQICKAVWGHPHPKPGICTGQGCCIAHLAVLTLGMK